MRCHVEIEGLLESRDGVPFREYRVVLRPGEGWTLQSRMHDLAEYAYIGNGQPPKDSYQWADHREPISMRLVARLLVMANRSVAVCRDEE